MSARAIRAVSELRNAECIAAGSRVEAGRLAAEVGIR